MAAVSKRLPGVPVCEMKEMSGGPARVMSLKVRLSPVLPMPVKKVTSKVLPPTPSMVPVVVRVGTVTRWRETGKVNCCGRVKV